MGDLGVDLRGALLGRDGAVGLGGAGGGSGGGGGVLQRAQSLTEPRVLGSLDLVQQHTPLVLQLLERTMGQGGEKGR